MDPTDTPEHARPCLPLARYRLHFRALDDAPLYEDPRGLWHGVLGRSLRAACCVTDRPECPGCPLLYECQYSYLFTAPRPPHAELMRRYDTVPVPHVLQLGAGHPEALRVGEPLAFDLVLVGEANSRLALMVEAFAAAGAGGLGAQRGRALLERIDREGACGAFAPIGSHGRLGTAAAPDDPQIPPLPAVVRVELLCPYKPSAKAPPENGMDLGLFLMALVRRTSLLQYFYTGRQLAAPFTALKAASLAARPLAHRLRRAPASRWAARHGRRVDLSGLVGSFDLDTAPIAALWPYLYLGQWLNVGKNASMGFGQYRLSPLA